jgi:hypothetical protein
MVHTTAGARHDSGTAAAAGSETIENGGSVAFVERARSANAT